MDEVGCVYSIWSTCATSHLDICILSIFRCLGVLLATARWFLTSQGTYIFVMHAYIFILYCTAIVSFNGKVNCLFILKSLHCMTHSITFKVRRCKTFVSLMIMWCTTQTLIDIQVNCVAQIDTSVKTAICYHFEQETVF